MNPCVLARNFRTAIVEFTESKDPRWRGLGALLSLNFERVAGKSAQDPVNGATTNRSMLLRLDSNMRLYRASVAKASIAFPQRNLCKVLQITPEGDAKRPEQLEPSR
mmetsp:Transcript_32718/g.44474  ORF Transcript_32718/g.44474 Transcript_32718/m.44474 type:complete len:107 (-) Transcript_32718:33-353(-)